MAEHSANSSKGTGSFPQKATEEPEKSYGFGWQFLTRFYKLHVLLFNPLFSSASALFFLLLCLVLLQEYIVYRVGLISSGFYMVLGARDMTGFRRHTEKSVALILAVCFVKSTAFYVQRILTVTFRKILSKTAHNKYFADVRYYQMNVLDKIIDNPDQRMTQDIEKFCITYCSVLPKLLISPFTIGYYCYEGYLRAGWMGPVGCFIFFLASTTINKFLMSPVVNYVVRQERHEGDFRFLHVLTRVHSESIAFHGGSLGESEKVDGTLETLTAIQQSLYWRQYFLNLFVNFVDYIGSIFSYMMLAIPILLTGEHDDLSAMDLTVLISQNSFILMYLIFSFTSVVDLAGDFTDIGGVTHRIYMLMERLEQLEKDWFESFQGKDRSMDKVDIARFDDWADKRRQIKEKVDGTINGVKESGGNETTATTLMNVNRKLPIWTLKNVTFSNPKSQGKNVLVSTLNMELTVGQSVLISGNSSAGKSSLFRVLRGLWPYEGGELKRHHPPGPHAVFYCPQRSYLTWGTLREQISFPLKPDPRKGDDKLIKFYIDKLKMTAVLKRIGGLDVPCSWGVFDSLSPGEIQRICLLRVFYHQPVVAVLDEVTSSLPVDIEDFVYSELMRLGITRISVGHRSSIKKYHEKQLIINSNDGGWQLVNIEDEKKFDEEKDPTLQNAMSE